MGEYYKKNGFHWTGTTFPRPPPTLPMIKPDHIGQKTTVSMTNDPDARQWHCHIQPPSSGVDDHDDPKTDDYVKDCLNDGLNPDENSTYRTDENQEMTIEVVAVEPRVFLVKNFLSTFEADYIVAQARPQLRRSTTGHGVNAREDDTRSSQSAWLTRGHSVIMDSIYRRVALVTQLPHELLRESKNAESLNVLHYPTGGEYTPHYDWGPSGKVASRFLSGLMYLNTPLEGGGTSFPKAKTKTYVPAQKGSFAFFYDLLEDGNGDVRSLHAGTSVRKGHKWVAPLWLWEPSVDGSPHEFGDIGPNAAKAGSKEEL